MMPKNWTIGNINDKICNLQSTEGSCMKRSPYIYTSVSGTCNENGNGTTNKLVENKCNKEVNWKAHHTQGDITDIEITCSMNQKIINYQMTLMLYLF